jgi:hypothetical protein
VGFGTLLRNLLSRLGRFGHAFSFFLSCHLSRTSVRLFLELVCLSLRFVGSGTFLCHADSFPQAEDLSQSRWIFLVSNSIQFRKGQMSEHSTDSAARAKGVTAKGIPLPEIQLWRFYE